MRGYDRKSTKTEIVRSAKEMGYIGESKYEQNNTVWRWKNESKGGHVKFFNISEIT